MTTTETLTDYQRGRLDGLRLAATFCMDYGHFGDAPAVETRRVANVYNLLGRLIAAVDCDACDMSGTPKPDPDKRNDYPCEHPGIEREYPPIEVQR